MKLFAITVMALSTNGKNMMLGRQLNAYQISVSQQEI